MTAKRIYGKYHTSLRVYSSNDAVWKITLQQIVLAKAGKNPGLYALELASEVTLSRWFHMQNIGFAWLLNLGFKSDLPAEYIICKAK